MDKEEAKMYIKRKGYWQNPISKEKADKENEEAIQEVMKKGKIYGDPMVELD